MRYGSMHMLLISTLLLAALAVHDHKVYAQNAPAVSDEQTISNPNASPPNQPSTDQQSQQGENTAALSSPETQPSSDDKPSFDKGFSPSFREDIGSVLYSEEKVSEMKIILGRIEALLAKGQSPDIEIADETLPNINGPAPAIIPDLRFPAFYIASIVYHSPKDWMLWINGQRVTAKRKYEGLQVAYVGPEKVQLIWKPDEWKYRQQIWNASVKQSKDLQRLAAHEAITYVDKKNKHVVATLRPNQTWVTATPLIVEGQHTNFAITMKPDANTLNRASEFSAKKAQELIAEAAKVALKKPAEKGDQSIGQSQNLPAANQAGGNSANPSLPTVPSSPTLTTVSPTPSLNDFLNKVGTPVPPTPNATGPGVISPPAPPASVAGANR